MCGRSHPRASAPDRFAVAAAAARPSDAALRRIDCHLIAVIDLRTPEATRRRLSELDAEPVMVDDPDERGGYLLSRLREVRRLCSDNPVYRWPNQYGNPANPDVHARTTGPEISRQGGSSCNTAYIAVSTGGSLPADTWKHSTRIID
ncbi:pyridoxal-phosphate dependent enzyme [Actinomadura rubrisoli]|uniref:Pyridoxal-phosphate dependent enzyme n=1 Tax=Actinomadura rubrisoli TaxID=2530368 RepID=A0A4V2YZF4_9ACTN|nr:pyridoxal-phosphate dependent enzyme [Actinomadura rubrisoli]